MVVGEGQGAIPGRASQWMQSGVEGFSPTCGRWRRTSGPRAPNASYMATAPAAAYGNQPAGQRHIQSTHVGAEQSLCLSACGFLCSVASTPLAKAERWGVKHSPTGKGHTPHGHTASPHTGAGVQLAHACRSAARMVITPCASKFATHFSRPAHNQLIPMGARPTTCVSALYGRACISPAAGQKLVRHFQNPANGFSPPSLAVRCWCYLFAAGACCHPHA